MSKRANPRLPCRGEDGQAFLEYVLMLAVVVSCYLILANGLLKLKLGDRIAKPITQDFAYTYRYGNPKTRGYDDGGPLNHVRAIRDGADTQNFRLFINQVPK